MKRIPIKQFLKVYTAENGTEVLVIHVRSIQCPVCLSLLDSPRSKDKQFVEIGDCLNCEQKKTGGIGHER